MVLLQVLRSHQHNERLPPASICLATSTIALSCSVLMYIQLNCIGLWTLGLPHLGHTPSSHHGSRLSHAASVPVTVC
jgi:hypothetical protein